MRICQVNAVPYGSTGSIMFAIRNTAKKKGYNTICTSGFTRRRSMSHDVVIMGSFFTKIGNYLFAAITGFEGYVSIIQTKKILKMINMFAPDIIHLHNLHGWYINLPMLFKYIKRNNIPVVWTLHDCWSFTGHCPHFTMAKCDKWKTGCYDCPSYRQYPQSFVDNSKYMYRLKKKWFTGVENLTIVTPSQWLADLTKQSFLKEYPVKVINNGINLSIFKPTESNFRQKYNIPESKKILLGVAFGWGKRKGLDVFVDLSKRLDETKYQIVLVGTDKKLDKQLPENIVSIHRTQNQKELAEIYTAADLFVNPTREENYPTVNMESIACGTPVLTFKTGGSPEILDYNTGSVVDEDDIDAMEREIIRICENRPYSIESCAQRAKNFDENKKYEDYIKLYEKIIDNKKNRREIKDVQR